jgi:hypothetical protein
MYCIRTGMGSRNYYWYSLNSEGHVELIGESRVCLWWGWQGAGLGFELCVSFSTSGAAERRGRDVCRDALTPRQQADMSLTLRVKHFQLSVKCKGEKITKVDFRGEYRQHCRNSERRVTIFPGFIDWFFVIQRRVFNCISYTNWMEACMHLVNWKGCERNKVWSWFAGREWVILRKTCEDSQSLDRDSNPGPPEYKVSGSTTPTVTFGLSGFGS